MTTPRADRPGSESLPCFLLAFGLYSSTNKNAALGRVAVYGPQETGVSFLQVQKEEGTAPTLKSEMN